MLTVLWYVLVLTCCGVALWDWRKGLYAGLVIDILRDVARKAVDGNSVAITLSGCAVWGVVIVACVLKERRSVRRLLVNYPHFKNASIGVLVALIPAAALSTLLYDRGWILAGLGAASYLTPLAGICVGYCCLRSSEEVLSLFRTYCILNGLFLSGVALEYSGIESPLLGGINYDWIRYRTGYIVDLMCGFYRSPDIMGLHAAHVVMFSIVLATRESRGRRCVWFLPALFASFCILVSGRRKMIGIPIVFLVSFVCIGVLRRIQNINRIVATTGALACIGTILGVAFWKPGSEAEYTDFAATLVTEGAVRTNEIIVGSASSTLAQSGFFGAGLGSATQGAYYAGVSRGGALGGWQEDGLGRLLFEFGVPGVLILSVAGLFGMTAVAQAVQRVPCRSSTQFVQIALLSVILGDAASFMISHQQFSGDPVSASMVTILLGGILVLGEPAPRRATQLKRTRSDSIQGGLQSPARKMTCIHGSYRY